MYNKLLEQSKQVYTERILKIYIDCNKRIDKHAEHMISQKMSKGEKSWILFSENYVFNTNYHQLFTEIIKDPYKTSILNRLREKFPEPEFRCLAEHVNYSTHNLFNPDSPDVNYYVIYVEWGVKDDCSCILF